MLEVTLLLEVSSVEKSAARNIERNDLCRMVADMKKHTLSRAYTTFLLIEESNHRLLSSR